MISGPALYDSEGRHVNCLRSGESYKYVYRVSFERAATNVRFGMMIKTRNGVELGGGSSANRLADSIAYVEAGSVMSIECAFVCCLNEGIYFLNAGVSGDSGSGFRHLHRLMDALCFRVNAPVCGAVVGTIDFSCSPEWHLAE